MGGRICESLGKQLMAQAAANLLRGTKVVGHRWTIYGLRLGDPVYLLGATKPRPAAELQAEGLDGTLGNSTIGVWGNEDAPGTRCTLMRGSELSNVEQSRSGFEMLVPPILLLLGGLSFSGWHEASMRQGGSRMATDPGEVGSVALNTLVEGGLVYALPLFGLSFSWLLKGESESR